MFKDRWGKVRIRFFMLATYRNTDGKKVAKEQQ